MLSMARFHPARIKRKENMIIEVFILPNDNYTKISA